MSYGIELESHRLKTRRGETRGLVYTLSHSFYVKRPIGIGAWKARTFYSMEKLEAWCRQRRWTLEKVRWFS